LKIIAVGGGKGGTGKTVFAANLSLSFAEKGYKVLLVDLDVDNPCTYTLFKRDLKRVKTISFFKPKLLEDKCTLCGECIKYCPVHALVLIPGKKLLFIKTLCEGCGNCIIVCPEKAIVEDNMAIGYILENRDSNPSIIVGELIPGERKTDEVMRNTLKYGINIGLKDKYDLIILDIPPGTGEGIYNAFKEADMIISITEPTKLGLNDFKKLCKLIEKMSNKKHITIINKYGLKGGIYKELIQFIKKLKIDFYTIPYDEKMMEAYILGQPVIKIYPNSPSSQAIKRITKKIEFILK